MLSLVLSLRNEGANLRTIKILRAVLDVPHQVPQHYVLLFAADGVGPVLAIANMLELMDAGCECCELHTLSARWTPPGWVAHRGIWGARRLRGQGAHHRQQVQVRIPTSASLAGS